MTLWIIILWTILVLLGLSLVYLGFKIPDLFWFDKTPFSKTVLFLWGELIALGIMGVITLCLDFVNAIVCILYLAMIWGITHLIFTFIQRVGHLTFPPYYAGITAVLLCILSLIAGWYLNHHVVQTNYTLTTHKNVPDFKIALLADVHLGTSFNARGFAEHLQTIQAQNPDIIVIVGDYVDDNTTAAEMRAATQALGQMTSPVYFVSGNHDKGYYGAAHRGFSAQDLINTLIENKVTVLKDDSVLIHDAFYIIGRKDASEEKEQRSSRQSMADLVSALNKDKYMIVLDHQPTDFNNQSNAGVDLVLSGHTHGGQLFPFNQIGKWIGANDLIYGHKKQNHTDFIVTSGISAWAIRFKTGTKSEFVIISVKQTA